MTAHTPGPLVVSHWPDESGQYPGWHIDKPTGPDRGEPVAMVWKEEDALLYAAAPETAAERDHLREQNRHLLDALEYLDGYMMEDGHEEAFTEGDPDSAEADILRIIRATIAKAKEAYA